MVRSSRDITNNNLNSHRRSRRGVQGPRSALTSFLEERGIRNRNPAPTVISEELNEREPRSPNQTHNRDIEERASVRITQVEENVNVSNQQLESEAIGTSEASRETAIEAEAQAENDIEEVSVRTRSQRRSNRKVKKRAISSDEESNSGSDDEFVISDPKDTKQKFSSKKANGSGGVHFCSRCQRRFVLTEKNLLYYGAKVDSKTVLLCNRCQHNETQAQNQTDAVSKSSRLYRRVKREKVLQGADFFATNRVTSLMEMAIKVICDHIHDIRNLGDISHRSMLKISRILSKYRRLDDSTLPLFLNDQFSILHLYDCARLSEQSFISIAEESPEIEELKIQFGGKLNDSILNIYASKFTCLTSLFLHGAFLVTQTGFSTIFETLGPQLEHLNISFSPKFGPSSMRALVNHCKQLEGLELVACLQMDDTMLSMLVEGETPKLNQLAYLNLKDSGAKCTDDGLLAILPMVGPALSRLNLSGFIQLTDASLATLKDHCAQLSELHLDGNENYTDAGLIALFDQHLPLQRFSLANGSIAITDVVLASLLENNHYTLRQLRLNALDGLSYAGLVDAFTQFPPHKLMSLDVSWVRAVSDPFIEKLVLDLGLNELSEIIVWGCHQVTESLDLQREAVKSNSSKDDPVNLDQSSKAARLKKLKIIGRECDTL